MTVGTTRSERRLRSRKRPLSLVYVELSAMNGGMMKDLSEEGFAVRAMMPLRLGEKTPFSFSLSENARIEGHGHILWVADDGRVAGVKFAEISSTAREQIHDWMIREAKAAIEEKPAAKSEPTLEQLREEMHKVPPRPEGVHAGALPHVEAREREPVAAEQPRVEQASAAHTEPLHEAAPAREEITEGPAVPLQAAHEARQKEKTEAAVEEVIPKAEQAPPVSEPVPPAPGQALRELGQTETMVKIPEPEPAEPTVAPVANTPVSPPASVTATPMEAAATNVLERQGKGPLDIAPELPRLSLRPKVFETPTSSAGGGSTTAPAAQAAGSTKQHWKPIPDAAEPESEPVRQVPHLEPLPDISTILMQPSGKAEKARREEAFGSWQDAETLAERPHERFPLTGLFTMMTILALLAGLYVFHRTVGQGLIWLGESLGGTQQMQGQDIQRNASSPASTAGVTAEPTGAQQSDASPAVTQPPTTGASTQEANDGARTDNPGVTNPVSPVPGPVAAPGSNVEAGQSEYAQAMQILRGRYASRDTPEALRLLWISVEKGNPNAELELAQMYWRGQGVVQNCDQALILLTAATRKGSAEAQRRLVEFQKQGCE